MRYKILSYELQKTKDGNPYKRLNIVNQAGQAYAKVPYWSSLPDYSTLEVGSYIEGEITTTQRNGYDNHSFKPSGSPQNAPRRAFGGGKAMVAEKAKNIEIAQNRKQEFIEDVQEKKQSAIDNSLSRNEVMYAKQSATELIAHHPAYNDLNREEIEFVFQNLTKAILDFNPRTSLTPLERDDIQSTRELGRIPQNDEIIPDDFPF